MLQKIHRLRLERTSVTASLQPVRRVTVDHLDELSMTLHPSTLATMQEELNAITAKYWIKAKRQALIQKQQTQRFLPTIPYWKVK